MKRSVNILTNLANQHLCEMLANSYMATQYQIKEHQEQIIKLNREIQLRKQIINHKKQALTKLQENAQDLINENKLRTAIIKNLENNNLSPTPYKNPAVFTN